MNLSFGRLSASLNGPIETAANDHGGVGFALLVGFITCIFSLCMAIFLVWIDRWAAKRDNVQVVISEDEKFRIKDLRHFNGLPFWLVTSSCLVVYMVIFPYVQFASAMLEDRFGFGSSAGDFYSLPYFISAFLSPITGVIIDKHGKRALFILISSIIVLLSCLITIMIPPAKENEGPQYLVLIPLILNGIGDAVYAAAIWACVPYTVPNKLVGTAFGLCTALQNVGLMVSPLLGAQCLKTTKQ